MEIALDDDQFWEKILPEMKTQKSLAARLAAGHVIDEDHRAEFLRDLAVLVEDVKEGMVSRSASYACQAANSARELHSFLIKLAGHPVFSAQQVSSLLLIPIEDLI